MFISSLVHIFTMNGWQQDCVQYCVPWTWIMTCYYHPLLTRLAAATSRALSLQITGTEKLFYCHRHSVYCWIARLGHNTQYTHNTLQYSSVLGSASYTLYLQFSWDLSNGLQTFCCFSSLMKNEAGNQKQTVSMSHICSMWKVFVAVVAKTL